ncbi:LysR substrate-binding domain-containing protein [Marinibacterium sp. SX1]|uniref:LysR substrate-binding domain-containing protein n=1 Tax=Marinibacterium sp. SX1 TaxID=3388424 RepID=UPI003D1797F0
MTRLPSLTAQQAFETLSRTLSVNAAADELCVTAGAVSRQVKLLEEHFGVALTKRVGRGIALTAQGHTYAEELRPAFDQLRRANQYLDAESSKIVISLRSYTTIATRWLIPKLARFQTEHPEIDVRLSMSSLWTNLGEYDAAIRLGAGWPEFSSIPLVPNTLMPVCSPQIAEKCRDNVQAITKEPLLSTPHRPDDWHLWLKAAGVEDPSRCKFMSFESSAVAYHMAINSQGIALAQIVLVAQELASGALECPIDFALDRGLHTYHLVWEPQGEKSDAIRLLGEWLQEQ